MQGQLTDLGPAVHQLHKRYSSEGPLTKEWGEVTREMADISTAAQRATTYVTKLKESWQHLLRDRASRTLTYNDEQFHILEKIKMTETIRILVALLVTECTPSITSRTEALADWYKMASTIYLQTEILFKDLSVYQDDIAAFSLGLRHSQDRYLQLLKEISSRLREVSLREYFVDRPILFLAQVGEEREVPPPAPTPQPPCDSRNVRRAVKSILGTQVTRSVSSTLHQQIVMKSAPGRGLGIATGELEADRAVHLTGGCCRPSR